MNSRNKIIYEFHKWRKTLLFADKIISIIVILLLGLIRPDFLVMSVYILLFPYLYLTQRKEALNHLAVSSLIALAWVIFANSHYNYNFETLKIFGLNSYPLFSFAVGLFAGYILYSHWEHKVKRWCSKLLLFSLIYWPLLILVETVAYYSFGIHNVATGIYAGLPICNCMHAPIWMQISYFLIGPIYFIICELLEFENPHYKRK